MSKKSCLFLGVLFAFLALEASAQEHSQRYRIYSQQNGTVDQNAPQSEMMPPPPHLLKTKPPGSLRPQ